MRALIATLIIALAVGVTGCAPSDDADEESAPATEESASTDEGSTEE